jgi:hypothetical protein
LEPIVVTNNQPKNQQALQRNAQAQRKKEVDVKTKLQIQMEDAICTSSFGIKQMK